MGAAAAMRGAAGVKSSSKFSIVFFSFGYPKVGWAHTTFDLAVGSAHLTFDFCGGLSPSPPPLSLKGEGLFSPFCATSTGSSQRG
jgi:hypothetical protein